MRTGREEAGVLPYARGITFSCKVIDLGNPLEVVLSHPNQKPLAQTASSVAYALRRAGDHCEVRSVHTPGILEDWLGSRSQARTLGLTLEELARQARATYLGAGAIRVQRGREEVRVYVRLPADERDSITDVEGYLLSTVSGAEVPVVSVASLNSGVLPPAIPRKDGQGAVMVTADVDPALISGDEANSIPVNSILADLLTVHPDPTYTPEDEQQREPLAALYRQFPIARRVHPDALQRGDRLLSPSTRLGIELRCRRRSPRGTLPSFAHRHGYGIATPCGPNGNGQPHPESYSEGNCRRAGSTQRPILD